MTSQVDEYRARAAEYDRKAQMLGRANAAIRNYYNHLAQHWRSLALLAEVQAARGQSVRAPMPVRTHYVNPRLLGEHARSG